MPRRGYADQHLGKKMIAHDSFSQVCRLIGALRSKNRAAYLGIALNLLKPFTKPIDKMLSIGFDLEQSAGRDIPPCVMIVSPPRSGSTIIYQALVRAIPSIYISNLHTIFPLHATACIMKRPYALSVLKSKSNYYGHTPWLRDVNEGNEFVDKLFKHGNGKKSIRNNFLKLIRTIQASKRLPFIFKNVRAYSQILPLHQAVPEIIFLRIKRDSEQVIQSVVRAYHELRTFHPIPENLKHSPFDGPVEFAVRQVLEIERTIDSQKENIKDAKWLEWHYEDFCENPWAKIKNLAECYLQLPASCLHGAHSLGSINASHKIKVTLEEAESIKEILLHCRQEKMLVDEMPNAGLYRSITYNG
jgi:hypothetical protein